MNAYLNYLLEASIGLCLFLAVYQLFLKNETSFRLNRVFLLIAVIASVTFPLIKIKTNTSPVPSLNFSIDASITETVGVTPIEETIYEDRAISFSLWEIAGIIYATGLAIFLCLFIFRLIGMFKAVRQSVKYTIQDQQVIELKSKYSPFSFFHYIFIGNTPPLTEKEKQQIVAHEGIHAKLYHSFDIVLLNILGIVFWFNPLIRMYKKIFVQLHEFEADARAVETHDVDEYCSLLARVALHSADYKLANHFSNSLTLKRIEMMRTLKHKIKSWKVVATIAFLPVLFFVVACQDQVESPQYTERVVNEPHDPWSSVPRSSKPIQERMEAINEADPAKKYIALDISDFVESKNAKFDYSKIAGQLRPYNLPEAFEMRFEDVDDPNTKLGFRRYLIVDINQGNAQKTPAEETVQYPQNVVQVLNNLKAKFPKKYYTIKGPQKDKPQILEPDGEMKRVVFENIIWAALSYEIISNTDKTGNTLYYLILEPLRIKKILPPKEANVDEHNRKIKVDQLPTKEEWKQAAHKEEREITEKEARPVIFFGPLCTNPEQKAIPPGGLTEFEDLLKRTAKYPEASRQAGIAGKVLIQVTISEKGKPAVFDIVKGINQELDQEALRIIKANSTGWKAAIEKGQAVTSQLVLTVEFEQ